MSAVLECLGFVFWLYVLYWAGYVVVAIFKNALRAFKDSLRDRTLEEIKQEMLNEFLGRK